MFKKLFMALLIFASTAILVLAENTQNEDESQKDGELVETYTEEYLTPEEVEQLGIKVDKVEEKVVQNHETLEEPKIIEKINEEKENEKH